MLVLTGHSPRLRCLAFSPDGRTLASCAGRGGRVWLWDLAKGKVRARLLGHNNRLECIVFAPTGEWMATRDQQANVGIWKVGEKKPTHFFSASSRYWVPSPFFLAFSPNGQALTTAHLSFSNVQPWFTHEVRSWDVATGTLQASLAAPAFVMSVAYSPDGRTLAVGDSGRNLVLWEVSSRQEIVRAHFPAAVKGLAFSPDGGTLALVQGWSVVLWDVASRKTRARLRGHKDAVWALAFLPDGQTLVTGSLDGTVRLWDVASGKERRAFDWKIGKVYTVAIAPDGMRAAAGGRRDIVVWDIDD